MGPRDVELQAPSDAASGDGFVADLPWGSYAATLDVPACPASPNPTLIVNGLSSELDGGETLADPTLAGTTLSLRESLFIAANRVGSDTIMFDVGVFPMAAPATITLGEDPFPNNVGPICLDGRERGVIVAWGTDMFSSNMWNLNGSGSLMVGLTLLKPPLEMRVVNSQVAGCRYNTDGYISAPLNRPWAFEVGAGGVMGPGNVFADDVTPIRWSPGATDVTVRGNYFGVDPLTRRWIATEGYTWELIDSIMLDANIGGRLFVTGNRIASRGRLFDTLQSSSPLGVVMTDNRIGRIEGFAGLPADLGGIYVDLPNWTIAVGPGNTITGTAAAVTIVNGNVQITQNSITGNTAAIVHLDATPPEPPVITNVSATAVTGSCAGEGLVELFADTLAEGAVWLGSTACTGLLAWSIAAAAPVGYNVTATFTDASARTSVFAEPFPVPN